MEMICWCGKHYDARAADVKRGWGLSCSKGHAAIRREYGHPRATRADGVKVKRVRKKDRGANRITPDTRTYVMVGDKLVDTRKLTKYALYALQDDEETDGHIFASGYFGHGQE